MHKTIGALFVLSLAALLFEGRAAACSITFDPSEVVVGADGKGTVTVHVNWQHRRCLLRDDDVTIEGQGVRVVSQSGWKKIRHGSFENRLEVLLEAAQGSVRVWRECARKGLSLGEVKVRRP